MNDELNEQISHLKSEINSLKTAQAARTSPWYRNASVVLSLVALMFSFGTTFVSYKRANDQEVLSTKQELRGLLQRLAALPKDNLEATKKYSDDPLSFALVSGYINNETSLLARQSAAIARKLPRGTVSPAEYHSIGMALVGVYDLGSAKEFYELALSSAQDLKDFNTEIGAQRGIASLYFMTGAPEKGRAEFEKASTIFDRYPGYDQNTKAYTQVPTELTWAQAEKYMGSSSLAGNHLDNAEKYTNELSASPIKDTLVQQVAQVKLQILEGKSLASPIRPQGPGATSLQTPTPLPSARPKR